MNRTTLLTLGIGALVVSGVVVSSVRGARSDLGTASRDSAAMAKAAAMPVQSEVPAPIVVAQTTTPTAPPVATARPAPPAQPAGAPGLTPEQVYMQDQASVARIRAQIDALMQQPSGGFYVTYYAKPAPPPPPPYGYYPGQQPSQMTPQQAREMQPGYVKRDRNGNAERFVVARAGDTVYATLDRAFNSDDPQAAIFATIHDVDNAGVQGPLDGVRMMGNIKYSSSQGSIQFDKAFLPDGRPIELKGIAISEDTARTGFAKDVDNHEIERYGGLLLATLVQGVGQVGQTLVQNNQQAMVDPNTGLLVAQQRFNPYQAAAGALLPAGQALTAVAAQGFNRPATISAPAGLGLGIVFQEPVVLPNDVLFARSR